MLFSRRRKGPKAGQKSNTNLKPDLHLPFKNASTFESLETNKGDRQPVGSKSANGKRKVRSVLDLSMEPDLNSMDNKVLGLVGSGSRITQIEFPIGLSIKFNQGLTLAKPVANSVKGKKDLARGRASSISSSSAVPSKEKISAPFSSHVEKFPSTYCLVKQY